MVVIGFVAFLSVSYAASAFFSVGASALLDEWEKKGKVDYTGVMAAQKMLMLSIGKITAITHVCQC